MFFLFALFAVGVGVAKVISGECGGKGSKRNVVKGKTFENMDIFLDGKKKFENSTFRNVNFKL